MTANGLTPPATGTPPPQTWPFTPNVAVASRALALGFLVMSMALLTASIAVLALFEDIALKHYLIATAFMIMGVVMAVAASRVYTLLIKGRGRRRA
jgi:hypothetical protein